jgi:hypothetical protein
MRHLADARDGPAIGVVQGVADFAFHGAAQVVRGDQFQAIGTSVFFFFGKLQFVPVLNIVFTFWFDSLFRLHCRCCGSGGMGRAFFMFLPWQR